MRVCPQCKKEYDDSWKVCLKCGAQLSEMSDSNISRDQFLNFAKDINSEFQKIDARLNKIEKALSIEPAVSERAGTVSAPKVEKIPGPAAQPQKPIKETRRKDIESTIGLVWLNRIGLLALFLGVAFFLKYAFDNRWIGELGRVILGLIAGFGMIVGSEFTRRKNYAVISQGLHGGGVGILYLSIFAAFGFYHLIGLLPAFLFMSIVTFYCGFWSTRTDWVSSAVIGVVGGFLTPFLLGPQNLAPSLLLSYVILLDLGVLYISLYKKWGALNIGTFFLTHAVFYNWFSARYTQENWLLAGSFATAFFALFCFLSILRNLLHKSRSDRTDIILVLVNGLAYFSWLSIILQPFAGTLPGLLPISLGCVYIVYSYSALLRCKEDKALVLSYVGLAVLFVTISIPVQLKYNWIAISWALEALLLIWLGFRLKFSDIRKFGVAIGLVSIFKILLLDYSYDPYQYAKNRFLVNERMFTYLVIVAALFAAAWLYKKNKALATSGERAMSTFLVLAANFVLLVQLSVESTTYFAHIAHVKASPLTEGKKPFDLLKAFLTSYGELFSARELTLSLLWVIYAFMMIAVGIYRKFRALRLMALVVFGVAVLKIFFLDLSQLDRAYRIISFISLGIVLIIASFFYQKYRDEIRDFALRDR